MTLQQPIRPPTARQAQVARLVAYGWEYKAIGVKLNMSARTARRHTEELAALIPLGEDEQFAPYMRVQIWAYWEYRVKPASGRVAA